MVLPDDWVVDYYDGGFRVAYDGPFDVYPLGFEALEISFVIFVILFSGHPESMAL